MYCKDKYMLPMTGLYFYCVCSFERANKDKTQKVQYKKNLKIKQIFFLPVQFQNRLQNKNFALQFPH